MMKPVSQKISAVFLLLAFVLAVAHCLCWIDPSETMACHDVQAAGCCCETGEEVAELPDELPPSLISDSPRLPGPELAISVPDAFSSAGPFSCAFQTADAYLHPVRSSPPLFLLHASFLI